jgi:hypothetical protein
MKSVVCNVFGMAVGVACLALVLDRAAADDDQPVVEEQKQVIVVQTDEGKADAAENLQKTLHDKLGGLPAEIQEKIQQKLEAVKKAHGSRDGSTPKMKVVSARQLDGKSGEDADVAIVVDDTPAGGEAETKTLTITVNNGEVLINGKPVKIPAIQRIKKAQIKVDARLDEKFDEEAGTIVLGNAKKAGEGVYTIVVDSNDAQGDKEAKEIRVRAVQVDPGHGHVAGKVFRVVQGKPLTHTVSVQATEASQAHADVVERLKSIESELKQIHKLLKEMQQGDDDDDRDDDDHD